MTRFLFLFAWWTGCSSPAASFHCQSDEACVAVDGQSGRCEESGYCSFEDVACESGWRYAAHSGDRSGSCTSSQHHGRPDASARD